MGILLNFCPSELEPGAEGGGDAEIVDNDAEELFARFVLDQTDFIAINDDFVLEGEFFPTNHARFTQFLLIECGVDFGFFAAGGYRSDRNIGLDSGLNVIGRDPVIYLLIYF